MIPKDDILIKDGGNVKDFFRLAPFPVYRNGTLL
jgi:hypothetical protein